MSTTRKPLNTTATRKPIVHTTPATSSSIRKPVNAGTSVKDVTKQMATLDLAQTRRRLSIMGTTKGEQTTLDGDRQFDEVDHTDIIKQVLDSNSSGSTKDSPKEVYKSFYSLSKVGYVPFNPSKVNQDRACEVAPFGKAKEKAFFAVFDGHGQLGHQVSQYVATNLPKFIMRQKELDTNPLHALTSAFVTCNNDLISGRIDCTFSGSTAVALYINGNTMYCCNAGDSRAVLARKADDGSLEALPLSSDHKPDREDEKKRILSSNGRVEACRGHNGVEIGPARVWLSNQDVPGLAMTRSFGDLVAASVGVVARPEIQCHEYIAEKDKMIIMGSDGIWEFISSQEAVDLVAKAANPEEACRILVAEADKRWRLEEEVVDDITALVIFL